MKSLETVGTIYREICSGSHREDGIARELELKRTVEERV